MSTRILLCLVTVILVAACTSTPAPQPADNTPTAASAAATAPAVSSPKAPELDDSTSLPGVYLPPHPGADGRVGTTDDRSHFANGVVVPICTPQQVAANNVSKDLH